MGLAQLTCCSLCIQLRDRQHLQFSVIPSSVLIYSLEGPLRNQAFMLVCLTPRFATVLPLILVCCSVCIQLRDKQHLQFSEIPSSILIGSLIRPLRLRGSFRLDCPALVLPRCYRPYWSRGILFAALRGPTFQG